MDIRLSKNSGVDRAQDTAHWVGKEVQLLSDKTLVG